MGLIDEDRRYAGLRPLGREATLVMVVVLHVLALIALFSMHTTWSRSGGRLSVPTLVTFLPTKAPPPAPRLAPKREARRAGGSPAAPRETMDAGRTLAPAPPALVPPPAPGPVWTVGSATGGDSTGAGSGSGASVGDGAGSGVGSGAAGFASGGITRSAEWARQISDEDLLPLLKDKIRRRGVAVTLQLSCEVMLTTRVRNCQVLDEVPPGSGLAQVVNAASRYFRIRPALRNGVATDGERVKILWEVNLRPNKYLPSQAPDPFA